MADQSSADSTLERLRADARYARERRDLYRARAYGQRPLNPDRLRELEREATAAAERLAFALRAAKPAAPGDRSVTT